MTNKTYVISLSAISGGGKTTVARELTKQLNSVAVVTFDDYKGELLGKDYCEWSESGADANEWHLEPIVRDIERMLSENYDYIVVDYPFGRSNASVNRYIDLAVFIDIPADIALARRIVRDYCRRDPGRKKLENPLEALDKNLMFYLKRHRETYFQHIKTVRPYCDLTVNGMLAPEEIAVEILNAVENC